MHISYIYPACLFFLYMYIKEEVREDLYASRAIVCMCYHAARACVYLHIHPVHHNNCLLGQQVSRKIEQLPSWFQINMHRCTGWMDVWIGCTQCIRTGCNAYVNGWEPCNTYIHHTIPTLVHTSYFCIMRCIVCVNASLSSYCHDCTYICTLLT
jgi:hypothetical protein